jgi:hypothetical protein
MIETMNDSLRRLAIAGAVLSLLAVLAAATNHRRSAVAASGERLTPAVRAAGLTFAPDVGPADQAWVLASIAKARPEAQRLIGAVDGLVTVRTVNDPGAVYVGMAESETDDVTLNIAFLDGDRKRDRDQTILHELGHIIDFELVPDALIAQLAAEIPSSGGCVTAERGDCSAPEERFADTFAKWALRGAVSGVGAGYGISSPASLETWGAPLAVLAVKQP